jgi:hypothetical protein
VLHLEVCLGVPGSQVAVHSGASADDLRTLVVAHADALAKRGQKGERGTVVVAAPFVPVIQSDFEAYLELAMTIEDDLVWAGLDANVQLATFHPRYQFADTEEEDVTNWTNRSPWPLFHLLREAEVGAAVESAGGEGATDAIWEANKATMEALGGAELQTRVMKGLAAVTGGREGPEAAGAAGAAGATAGSLADAPRAPGK